MSGLCLLLVSARPKADSSFVAPLPLRRAYLMLDNFAAQRLFLRGHRSIGIVR